MNDLDRARLLLASDPSLTCAFVRGEESFTRAERGIAPLVGLLSDGAKLGGFSAADRIVGKAAAFLYAALGVDAVYAEVLSADGEKTLDQYGIAHACARKTERIVNRRGDGPCPMERAVADARDFESAIPLLKAALAALKG